MRKDWEDIVCDWAEAYSSDIDDLEELLAAAGWRIVSVDDQPAQR